MTGAPNSRARPNNKGTKGNKGGRPPGSSTQLTRFELNKVAKSGKSPVDIMLKNMWWWDEQAEAIGEQIQTAVSELASLDEVAKAEQLKKLSKQLDAFTHARDKAQSCAVEAAPYCHAKLQSIALKPDNKNKVIEVETVVQSSAIGATKPEEGAKNSPQPDRSYRDGYNASSVIPIRRAG